MKRKILLVSLAWLLGQSNAAISDPTVLGAMQSFHDFCMSSYFSIDAIANEARERHYNLVVSRRLPGLNGSTIINMTWQVADVTGEFALTATQTEGSSPDRRFECGVTLPKGTEKQVESALMDPSRFGTPAQTNINGDGSRLVRWIAPFKGGVAEVSLTSQIPSLQGGSMINVLYRVDK